ncbi:MULTISPECIES: pectate lyase family protein [Alteromonas]|uniref:Pectate lyase C n=1 Tax=Alteromonas stellipolaris TaxID=233316 RepID=A0AAW7Z8K3_9ALTE|nr:MULTISPECIES: pectate lyase C [Alteromonas]ALM89368.1 Pectate lyase [Alteromonas stellipolaris LMG 21856]MDO6534895.1 pectate lyase C [Alteromonas stellipolaris]MDO6578867.1 pectate lyase C [Alteromonas stellipolaris]MDO6626772.1 pectate lyase C [Alteromonas stellipolaris]MDP2594855.1 pectate lyase C [Alteromonas stellipolaris]
MKYLVSGCVILSCVFFYCGLFRCEATPLAFDGARGFGKYTEGGNRGRVLVVSSLNDNAKSPQKGTLRWAVRQAYPRLIVFSVSGIIHLEKELEIKHGNVTIAGHTSPRGIVISGASTSIEANQVIFRHLRFRPGRSSEEGDALTVRNTKDVIIDHCSLSWSSDEVGSFYNNERFTLQNSILSESLNNAGHHKGNHGYGGIWGGSNASFIQNLLANHTSRNPRINGWRLKPLYAQKNEFVDIRNNIIANWQSNSTYGGENGKANLVGNVYVPGPATQKVWFYQIWALDNPATSVFIADNVMRSHPQMTSNNRLGVVVKNLKLNTPSAQLILDNVLVDKPLNTKAIDALNDPIVSAEASWNTLIINRNIGANQTRYGMQLDPVDTRILAQLTTNTYMYEKGIIDNELDVMAWEDYNEYFNLKIPSNIKIQQPVSDEKWQILAGITPNQH